MSGCIGPSHLERRAMVYVRQSTTAQVLQHAESTQRQYALAQRAQALGWAPQSIEVIDEDQGKSGATADGRDGFARLVHSVAHGQAGAVLAIEVSRLARSSEDWQRLLSLCAVADVVVIDEQAIYDPSNKDDKLLLDIKGTMSEAELHWLGLRLAGARQSKARRGELRIPAPTGYVWSEHGLALDPDEAVQNAIKLVFERYAIEPSVWAVVRWARETGVAFPTRRQPTDKTMSTTVMWKPLGLSRLQEILKNPTYAGVYVYGRRPERKKLVDGEIQRVRASGRDPEAWAVRIENAHPGYITWEVFLKNQQKLQDNLNRMGRKGAAREGTGLLSGLVVCGRCGRRMVTGYQGDKAYVRYRCVGERDKGQVICWTTPGACLDRAVEQVFLQTMVPSELELSLAVEREVGVQTGALERQLRARLEQAAYEARQAERRYKAVDPDNRVVARTLEREWEQRLEQLEQLELQRAQAKRERHLELSDQDRATIRALASDLPTVRKAPTTKQADRKAMLRLVIEAISLQPVDVPERQTYVRIAWKSGAVTELKVPRPDRHAALRTAPSVVQRLRELAAEGLRDEEIAERLNREKLRTGRGKPWDTMAVRWARRREAVGRTAPDAQRRLPLPDRYPDGRYSLAGVAKRFGVHINVVRGWIARGLISGQREPYGAYPRVWWLRLDDDTIARIEQLATARSR